MAIIKKDKRAISGDVYLSPWMFLNWAIIAVCIIIGVIIFRSSLADARTIESEILAKAVVLCISDNFNYEEITNVNFNIFEKCNFNRKSFEDTDFYYFNLSISDGSSGKLLYSISKGNGIFQAQCDYRKIEKNFAQCSYQSINIADDKGKRYLISVTAASNQR